MLNWLLNSGWDPDTTDPTLLRRIRTLTATAYLLLLICIPFILRAYEWQIAIRMITVPAAAVLALSCVLILRFLKLYDISTQLVTLAVFVGGLGALLSGGGIGASVLGWWLLVPILAGLLRGLSSGVGWSVIVIASIYACFWAQQQGFAFPDLTPPEHRLQQSLLQGVGLVCGVLVLVGNYLSQIGFSERRLAERNRLLKQQVARAEQAEHDLANALAAKTRFLANMSHEMKTPLNAIVGFSHRLQKSAGERLEPREHDALAMVQRHSNLMLSLVNDLLQLSHMERGDAPPQRQPLDLKELLTRVTLALAPEAERLGLSMACELDNSLVVEADGEQIRQVVEALLRHGLKYTTGEQVDVVLGELPQGALVQVRYRGEMTDEGKARLFDRYNHLHSQGGRDLDLSGLALPLAFEHIQAHEGRLSINGDPTADQICFNLFLPH